MHGPHAIPLGSMPASSNVDVYMESNSLEFPLTTHSSTPLNIVESTPAILAAVKQENVTNSQDTNTINYNLDPFPSSYSSQPSIGFSQSVSVAEDKEGWRQNSVYPNHTSDQMQQQDAKVFAWNHDNESVHARVDSVYPSSTHPSIDHSMSVSAVAAPASPTAHVKSTVHTDSNIAHTERDTTTIQTGNTSNDTLSSNDHPSARLSSRVAPSASTIQPHTEGGFHATSQSNRHFPQQPSHSHLTMPPSIASSEASASSDNSSFQLPSSHPSSRGSSVVLGRGIKREREDESSNQATLHTAADLHHQSSANSHDNVRVKLEQETFATVRRFTDSSLHTSVHHMSVQDDGTHPAPDTSSAEAEINHSRSRISTRIPSHLSTDESAASFTNTGNGRRNSNNKQSRSVAVSEAKPSESMTIDNENVEEQRHRKMPRLQKDDSRSASSPHSDPLSTRTIRDSDSPNTNRKPKLPRQQSDSSATHESKQTAEVSAVSGLSIPSTLVSPLIPTFARLSHVHSIPASIGHTPKSNNHSKRGSSSRFESSAGSSASVSANASPCHQSTSATPSSSSSGGGAFSSFPTPSSKRASIHIPARAAEESPPTRPRQASVAEAASSKQHHHSAATTPKQSTASHPVVASVISNSAKRPAMKIETTQPPAAASGKTAPSPAEDVWAPLPLPVGGIITGKGNGAAAGITIPNPIPGKRGGGFSCHCCKTSKKDIDDLFLCTNILPKDPYDHKCIAAANLAAAANMKAAQEAPVTSSKKKNSGKGKDSGSHKKSNHEAPMEIVRVMDAATLEEMKRSAALIKNCKKKYCTACMKRLYSEEYQMLFGSNRDQWCCPSCLNRCTCAGCERRIQGEDEAPWRKRKPDQNSSTESVGSEEKVKKEQQNKVKQEAPATTVTAAASIKKEKKDKEAPIIKEEEKVKVKKEKKEKEKEKEEEKKDPKPSASKKKAAAAVSSNPQPPSLSNTPAVKQVTPAPSTKSNKHHKPAAAKTNVVPPVLAQAASAPSSEQPKQPQQQQQPKKPKTIRVKKEITDASETTTTTGVKRKSGGGAATKRLQNDRTNDDKQLSMPSRPAPALRLPSTDIDVDDNMNDDESNSSVSDADSHQDFSAFPSKTLDFDMNDDVGASSANLRSPQALPTPSQYDSMISRQRGHPLTSSDSLPRDVFQPQFEAYPFKSQSQASYTDYSATSFFQTSASVSGPANVATPRSAFSTESSLPHHFSSFAMPAPSISPPVITSSASSYISTQSQTKLGNDSMDAINTQDLARRDSFPFFYTASAATSMSSSAPSGNYSAANNNNNSNLPYSPFTALGIGNSSQRSTFESNRETEPQQQQPQPPQPGRYVEIFTYQQPSVEKPLSQDQQMPARPTSDAELDQMLIERGQQLLQQQRMTNRLLEQLQQLQQAGLQTQQQHLHQARQQQPLITQSSFSAGSEPWSAGDDLSQRPRQVPPAPMFDYPSASPPAFQSSFPAAPVQQMNTAATFQPLPPSQQQVNRPHQSYPPPTNDYGYPMA